MKKTFITNQDDAALVAYAASIVRTKKERGTFRAYMVAIPGEGVYWADSKKGLAGLLSTIIRGAACEVFRNYAGGVTVQFYS